MWTFKRTHVDALQKAAAAFKTKTGIDVTIEAFTPDDVFTSKMQGAAQTKDLPDVLELHSGGEDLEMGAAGLLTDLTARRSTPGCSGCCPPPARPGVMTQQRIDIVAKDAVQAGQVGHRSTACRSPPARSASSTPTRRS